MSVVDLCRRATSDWDEFNRFVRSSDSLVFFENGVPAISDPPGSVDLCVGTRWFDPDGEKLYKIDAKGLVIKAHSCVVVEVDRRLALPHNVMGIVVGKGKFIFRSALVSTGKIDPGFDGKLRIGFQNASAQEMTLNVGTSFCSCFFFNTESEVINPRRNAMEPDANTQPLRMGKRWSLWWSENWKTLVPICVSMFSLVVAAIGVAIAYYKK